MTFIFLASLLTSCSHNVSNEKEFLRSIASDDSVFVENDGILKPNKFSYFKDKVSYINVDHVTYSVTSNGNEYKVGDSFSIRELKTNEIVGPFKVMTLFTGKNDCSEKFFCKQKSYIGLRVKLGMKELFLQMNDYDRDNYEIVYHLVLNQSLIIKTKKLK